MDSRIREIEHRLAMAKTGLAENGREDYLKQLYLLDAEIRAAIRSNGDLPDHLKELIGERSAQVTRRRSFGPGLAFASMMLIAAVTYGFFWLSEPVASPGATPTAGSPALAAEPQDAATDPVMEPEIEIVPLFQGLMVAAEPGLAGDADPQPEVEGSSPEPRRSADTMHASRSMTSTDNKVVVASDTAGETGAVAVNFVPPVIDTPEHDLMKGGNAAAGDTPSFAVPYNTGFNWTIARFALPAADANRDQEIEVINILKQQVDGDSVDSDNKETTDSNVDKKLSTSGKNVDK